MKVNDIINESASAEQLTEEFDLIESIINRLAEHNGVDAEVIWEDLETLSEDELYAFAVTSEPIMESQGVAEGQPSDNDMGTTTGGTKMTLSQWKQMWMKKMPNADFASLFRSPPSMPGSAIAYFDGWLNNPDARWDPVKGVAEDWQKANKRDRTAGMSQKAVNAYRRENPGSKLKTAVTTKPSKLKRGSKASKRRKSYCSRSRGQMKMHSISCAKTPDKAICKARRRWNC